MNDSRSYWAGKRVLVTGGTAGLGRALTHRLDRLNARIAVVARGAPGLERLTRAVPRVLPIQGDVSDKDQVHSIAAQAFQRLEGIDLLINNASTLGVERLKPLIDTECEELQAAVETNLLGPFRLTRILLGDMLLRSGGTVVNITSDASVSPYPTWGAYSVSKAALDHLTRIWDAELGSRGVRFFAVDPGDMDTAMHRQAVPDADVTRLRSPDESARRLLDWVGDLRAGNEEHEIRRSL